MKIFLRISYAFVIAGILAFVNIDIERREVNNFYANFGRKAVKQSDYCFFYKFMGWHTNNDNYVFSYTAEDSSFEIKAYEIYLTKYLTGTDPNKFVDQNIVIFLKIIDQTKFKNKYCYLVLTDGEKIIAEPLKITSYKAVPGLLATNYTNGETIIPIDYFVNIKKELVFAHILLENKYQQGDKLTDTSGKIPLNFKFLKTKLHVKEKYLEFSKIYNYQQLATKLKDENVFPPVPFYLSDNVRNTRITFSLFYVSFSVLLTYSIFFLPQFIKDTKRNRKNLKRNF